MRFHPRSRCNFGWQEKAAVLLAGVAFLVAVGTEPGHRPDAPPASRSLPVGQAFRPAKFVSDPLARQTGMSAPPLPASLSEPLQGEQAVAALKKQGGYESLRQAYEAARYRIEPPDSASAGPYQAWNPAQKIQAEFSAEETRLRYQDRLLVLRLTGYGYGERLRKPEAVPQGGMVAEGNRVEYRRGVMVEWYMNQPQGLEQGFTLSVPPVIPHSALPTPHLQQLLLAMEFTGGLRPALDDAGQAVRLQAEGRTVLRYVGLKAWDATGRLLPSRLEVRKSEVRIVVDDGGAVYPLTVDPSFTQDAKLTASDSAAGDQFGSSVALDGNTAVVGAPFSGGAGSAYVFVRNSAGVWSQQQKLTASDAAAGDFFGGSGAVSGDTAVVGAHQAPGTLVGAAYVFVRSAGIWTQQQKLTASDGAAGDEFGVSVAVSGDTAVVGAPLAPFDSEFLSPGPGSAYVFVRSGGVWSQQQKLTASDATADDNFGFSVALSGDTAVVGAWADDTAAGADAGSAYVFVRSSGVWSQQQKLTASDSAAGDQFGSSVALDGNTAVVGAPSDETAAGLFAGSAYVFVRSGSVWSQQQKLTASDAAASDDFGISVSLSGDTAVVGAPFDTTAAGSAAGSAYVFVRSGSTWSQNQKLTASDAAANDEFGSSVAVSGATVLVGACCDDTGAGVDAGSAYVFVRRGKPQTIIVQQWGAGRDVPSSESARTNPRPHPARLN